MASVEPNLTRSVKWVKAALMDRRRSDRSAFVRFDITTGGLMSTLEAEKDTESPGETTGVVEIIDCGRASERTQGFAWLTMYEGGIPPHDRLIPF